MPLIVDTQFRDSARKPLGPKVHRYRVSNHIRAKRTQVSFYIRHNETSTPLHEILEDVKGNDYETGKNIFAQIIRVSQTKLISPFLLKLGYCYEFRLKKIFSLKFCVKLYYFKFIFKHIFYQTFTIQCKYMEIIVILNQRVHS